METVYIEQWGLWAVHAPARDIYVKAHNAAEAVSLAALRLESAHVQ